MDHLTQKQLRTKFLYDEETGVLTRRESYGRVKAGQVVGCDNGRGYLKTCREYVHRLVWCYTFGYWPEQVDHINHDKGDNRLQNLREVSNSENHRNMGVQRNNTSGHTGVSWDKKHKKWEVNIKVSGKKKFLGYFSLLEDAVVARRKGVTKFGFHLNHGVAV
jgi:hypothetical protein